MKNYALSLALVTVSGFALAQTGGIGSVKIEPATVAAGKEVKITIAADGEAPAFCGMVVHFGDGSESRNVKIDSSEAKFPVSFGKSFAKPGTYTVKAEGKKITTHFPCLGKAEASVTVTAAPAAAKTEAKAAGPTCPEGYAMKGKAGKAGDFTCTAGKGAKKPEKVLDCGDRLEYFQTKTSLGCRKAK